MTLTGWRLVWRQQRWELLILIGGALALAVALLAVAWQTGVTNDALAACVRDQAGPTLSAECRSTVEWGNLLTALGAILPRAATVAPFVVGLLLGAPLVSREIEKRTAHIAWSLSPSRRRWLVGRTVPLTLLVGLSLLALGLAGEVLEATNYPDGRGFMDYGSHGPLIAARGVAIFSLGILVGLAAGRVLPAILLTAVVAVAVFGAVEYGRGEVMRAEATWMAIEDEFGTIAMIYDSRLRSDHRRAHHRRAGVRALSRGVRRDRRRDATGDDPRLPRDVARSLSVLRGSRERRSRAGCRSGDSCRAGSRSFTTAGVAPRRGPE